MTDFRLLHLNDDVKDNFCKLFIRTEAADLFFKFTAFIEDHIGETEYKKIINIPDNHKITLLHYACRAGHIDIVKYLLKWGCAGNFF